MTVHLLPIRKDDKTSNSLRNKLDDKSSIESFGTTAHFHFQRKEDKLSSHIRNKRPA